MKCESYDDAEEEEDADDDMDVDEFDCGCFDSTNIITIMADFVAAD